jgi:hypothetical protein
VGYSLNVSSVLTGTVFSTETADRALYFGNSRKRKATITRESNPEPSRPTRDSHDVGQNPRVGAHGTKTRLQGRHPKCRRLTRSTNKTNHMRSLGSVTNHNWSSDLVGKDNCPRVVAVSLYKSREADECFHQCEIYVTEIQTSSVSHGEVQSCNGQ